MQKTTGIVALLMLVGLTSCAIKPDPTDPGPPPSDYKKILKSYIHENIFDPYSMYNVAIGDPVQGHISSVYGWLVCLQANTRNPKEGYMGGYLGISKTAYLIKDDAVVKHEDKSPSCDTQKLVPWPEMENGSSSLKNRRIQ